MPPANQGSKAALITWTVVATVFGITMAVLALIAYAGRNEAERRLASVESAYQTIAADADLTGPRVSELVNQARAEGRTGNVLNYLAIREENLANISAGTTDYQQAVARINSVLERLQQTHEVDAPSLAAALEQISSQLEATRRQNEQVAQVNEQLRTELVQQREIADQQLAEAREQVQQAQDQLQEARGELAAVTEIKDALAASASEEVQTVVENLTEQLRQREEQITQAEMKRRQLQDQLDTLTRSKGERVPTGQALASADGRVLRAPVNGRLFIDIGRQQRVSPGMTFQVYGADQGVPSVAGDDGALPRGKGSIQVVSVDPSSAEARVIHEEPGQTIRQGDVIANLAFDRNAPVRIRVYGEFDLENRGRPDPQDRDRLMTLIREFGGRVMDNITVETDLVVMGREPVVPQVTQADLQDPTTAAEYYEAVRRREQYLAIQQQAQELNIPILNQNQFLYYIGYYEQVRR